MKQSNAKIAVTGGIGSGKSTVCRLIEEAGFPVFSFDKIYSELLKEGKLSEAIAEEFGAEILNTDGTLDRCALSEKIFGNDHKRQKLNEITHPKIFNRAFSLTRNLSGLIFFEVPLLFEGGYQNKFDEVVVVLRSRSARIVSVSERDNLSVEKIERRIKSQYDYDNMNFAQYYVIHNDGNFDDLCNETTNMLAKITHKYN